MSLERVHTEGGFIVFLDTDLLLTAYGAHALRVSHDGGIQLLMVNPDDAEWIDVTNAELVQPAGKPVKARKQ